MPVIHGNSEKSEEGVEAFSVFTRSKPATWGQRPLATAQMCQYSEPLHGHPNHPIGLSSLELPCMCVQSVKEPLTTKKTHHNLVSGATHLAKLLKDMAAGC